MPEFQDDLNELLNDLVDNMKDDMKDFNAYLNLDGALKREVYLKDIEYGVGGTIESQIRFWNEYDKINNIPIEERKPIMLYIDSNGGSLCDALTIIDAIQLSKTPVWTIVTGAAYSGGFFTAICGHRRFAYPHSSFLFHEGSAQNGGTSSQFENFSKFYRRQLDQLRTLVLEKTSLGEDWYKEHQKEDMWFLAEEALENGCIDEICEEYI